MGKSTRKCEFCEIHKKKHYDQKEKKRCENERLKILRSKRENESLLEKETINELKQNIEENFQIEVESEVQNEENSQEVICKKKVTFGPHVEETFKRIFRQVKERYTNWGEQLGKKSDFEIREIALFEYQQIGKKLDEVQILKFQLDESQNSQEQQKLKKLIKKLELEISPHSHFRYISLPKFKDDFELEDFLHNLSEVDFSLYDPDEIEEKRKTYEKILLKRKEYSAETEQLRKNTRITRSGFHYHQPIQNIYNDFYYNNKIEEEKGEKAEKRKYIKKNVYTKAALREKRRNMYSFQINRGFIRALKRRERIGQYRFKTLPGDNELYGIQPTNDKNIRRVRFQLLYNPWTRLLFSQNAINTVFGRFYKGKTISKSREGKQWRNICENPKTDEKCFLETNYEKKPIILRHEADFKGSLFGNLVETWENTEKRNEIHMYEELNSERGLLPSESEGENELENKILQPKKGPNTIFFEDNSESEIVAENEERNDEQSEEIVIHVDEKLELQELLGEELDIERCQKDKNVCDTIETDQEFIDRNLKYMTKQERFNFLERYKREKSTIEILKRRKTSLCYYSYMYTRFCMFQKEKNHDGWIEFMQNYNVTPVKGLNKKNEEVDTRNDDVELSDIEIEKKLKILIYGSEERVDCGETCVKEKKEKKENQINEKFEQNFQKKHEFENTTIGDNQEERNDDIEFLVKQLKKQKLICEMKKAESVMKWRKDKLRPK